MQGKPDGALAVVTDPRFADHSPTGFHPERPARLHAAERGLARVASQLDAPLVTVPTRDATAAELARVHAPAYVDRLLRTLRDRGAGFLDGDTYFSPGSREAAWRAAGGAAALVEAVVRGEAPVGALLARPPGHHATRERAMGFCLLNNVAVAAAHALALGLDRVAVVDWDVHHGNGTQDIFADDPRVLFVSLHQWPLYPGTGAAREVGGEAARGRTVNVPLPAEATLADYRAAFDRVVLPLLEAHAPQLVLVSAGFDAHEADPLSSMRLRSEDYATLAALLRERALRSAEGRMVLALEGGYDLPAIEQSLAHALEGALGRAPVAASAPPSPETDAALREVLAAQRPYWPGVL